MRPPSRSVSVPAPVGGWNARDALADMPETDAVILDRGHVWCKRHATTFERDGHTRVGFPSEGKMRPITIMELEGE